MDHILRTFLLHFQFENKCSTYISLLKLERLYVSLLSLSFLVKCDKDDLRCLIELFGKRRSLSSATSKILGNNFWEFLIDFTVMSTDMLILMMCTRQFTYIFFSVIFRILSNNKISELKNGSFSGLSLLERLWVFFHYYFLCLIHFHFFLVGSDFWIELIILKFF